MAEWTSGRVVSHESIWQKHRTEVATIVRIVCGTWTWELYGCGMYARGLNQFKEHLHSQFIKQINHSVLLQYRIQSVLCVQNSYCIHNFSFDSKRQKRQKIKQQNIVIIAWVMSSIKCVHTLFGGSGRLHVFSKWYIPLYYRIHAAMR